MRYRAEDFQKDFWVNIGKRIRLRREQVRSDTRSIIL